MTPGDVDEHAPHVRGHERLAYEKLTSDWDERERSLLPLTAFEHHGEIDSTSTRLLDRVRSGEGEGFQLVVADYQTAGRGRRGDRWEASPGTNLLFSFAAPLGVDATRWTWIPHFAAMAVGRVIESISTSGIRVQAKWPNDLLVEDRKICGILVETISQSRPHAILGIGLNVNMRDEEFPPLLRGRATSLYELEGCESSRWYLLGLVVQLFLREFEGALLDPAPIAEWYGERDWLRGKEIEIRTMRESHSGIASGIGDHGELLLSTRQGVTRSIVSAEEIMLC